MTRRSSDGSPHDSASRRLTWTRPLIAVSGLRSSCATLAATFPLSLQLLAPLALDRRGQHVGDRLEEIHPVRRKGLAPARVRVQDAERPILDVENGAREADRRIVTQQRGALEPRLLAKVRDTQRFVDE